METRTVSQLMEENMELKRAVALLMIPAVIIYALIKEEK